jgi:hypothetical protein
MTETPDGSGATAATMPRTQASSPGGSPSELRDPVQRACAAGRPATAARRVADVEPRRPRPSASRTSVPVSVVRVVGPTAVTVALWPTAGRHQIDQRPGQVEAARRGVDATGPQSWYGRARRRDRHRRDTVRRAGDLSAEPFAARLDERASARRCGVDDDLVRRRRYGCVRGGRLADASAVPCACPVAIERPRRVADRARRGEERAATACASSAAGASWTAPRSPRLRRRTARAAACSPPGACVPPE